MPAGRPKIYLSNTDLLQGFPKGRVTHPSGALKRIRLPDGISASQRGSPEFHKAIAADINLQEAYREWYWQNPVDFLHDCIRIIGKDKKLHPFDIQHPDYRRAQIHYMSNFLDQWWTTGRVRLTVLKARQGGITSITNALFLYFMLFSEYGECMTLADKHTKGEGILRMLQGMHDRLPPWLKPRIKRAAVNVLLFDGFPKGTYAHATPNISQLQVETANADAAARSLSLSGFLASELAFWQHDPNLVLDGCRGAVVDVGKSIIVLESTACGYGGVFWEECDKARKGESEYRFIFLPSYSIDEYRLKRGDSRLATLPGNPVCPVKIQKNIDKGDYLDLDDEETAIIASGAKDPLFGPVGADFLLWRRWAIPNKCGGSLSTFHAEHPTTVEEAFISTGTAVFRAAGILRQEKENCRPGIRGILARAGGNPEASLIFTESPSGLLEIWDLPVPGHEYIITVDPAEGDEEASGLTGPSALPRGGREGKDQHSNSAVFLYDRNTRSQVARAKGRFTPDVLATMVYALGEFYNQALVVIERTGGYGQTAIELGKELGYGGLYTRHQYGALASPLPTQYGWSTDGVTRPLAFATARRRLRDGDVILRSVELMEELRTMIYVRAKVGAGVRERPKPGCKDDEAMSYVICMQVDEDLMDIPMVVPGKEERELDPVNPLTPVWEMLRQQEQLAARGRYMRTRRGVRTGRG